MKNRWSLIQNETQELVLQLAQSLGISQVLAKLLVTRQVTSFEEAKAFFRPSLSNLHDPFLMRDMDKAIARIFKAIEAKQRILVYGDYDVDGTTAVSLVYSFLLNHTKELDYYIPDRYAEGYGISFQGIDFAKANGFSLIIALDCGIKSLDKVDYASELGIDFIICDHHLPGEKLPKAVAVLDPKRNDCNYPYKELSGCGIGFKLIQAFSKQKQLSFDALEQYLDLTAISTACDIVPITGENRILTYFGLKQLNESPRAGIKAILELAAKTKEITVTDLVFIVGPRINAAGRIEHAKKAVELLISNSPEIAVIAGKAISETNSERKELDKSITEHALQLIEKSSNLQAKTTVLFHPEWHKGVIGIVASRLIETHYRPTIVLTESNGKATGSARSVKGFDIHEAIDACSDLLEQFGGHKYAAGLTLKLENIAAFQQKFETVVSQSIDDRLLVPEIEIDAEIDFSEITDKFFRILNQFAPFGPQNMKPVFLTKNVISAGYTKAVGQQNDHLKLDVCQVHDSASRFSGIAFNLGHLANSFQEGKIFDITYSLEENEWNGKTSIQLKVVDLRVSR